MNRKRHQEHPEGYGCQEVLKMIIVPIGSESNRRHTEFKTEAYAYFANLQPMIGPSIAKGNLQHQPTAYALAPHLQLRTWPNPGMPSLRIHSFINPIAQTDLWVSLRQVEFEWTTKAQLLDRHVSDLD